MYYSLEFYKMTQDILLHPVFAETRSYVHHGPGNSLFDHSVSTAFFAYRVAKRLRLSSEDVRSITRAALLHDFTGYDWRAGKREIRGRGLKRIWNMHAFQHGFSAAEHASKFFWLTDRQRDAIKKHMFPLVPMAPRYKEGWIVTYSDKIVASKEMGLVVWQAMKKAGGSLRRAFA